MTVEAAAGLSVSGAGDVPGASEARRRLVDGDVPARLAGKDPSLWGPDAAEVAKIRLGWLDTFARSRELLPRLTGLREELAAEGVDHVVLAGMGGSSLAPEVITRTLGVPLTVLDTTDPHQIARALADRLERSVVVVASKSGSTVETDSHRRAYAQAFTDAGIDPGSRLVVVTDPGSPLAELAEAEGARAVFLADAEVGGRYSALTAFGLVPSALAGVDVAELIDQAAALASSLGDAEDNPALALGAALGAATSGGRDKLAIAGDGSGIVGLGDWIEQLIAESTGKAGTGILPVVLETPDSPGAAGPDVLPALVGGSLPAAAPGSRLLPDGIAVNGPLGAQFLSWEYATAIASAVIGVEPFDQPNVAESKDNTKRLLASGVPAVEPDLVDGAVALYLSGISADSLEAALAALLAAVPERGYLAVMAYLDRVGDAGIAGLRPMLAGAARRAVTFGWGPRFLHSTGQYHKGGPQHGAFLQITGTVAQDLPVPGRPYSFGQLQAAQAAGDLQALAGRDRPVLRLHLTDRATGVAQLLAAAETLG
ncbi:MAG: glucose-6-phosphate isomerase [Micromonosporaceae bacterium]